MTRTTATPAQRRSATATAGLAIAALLVLGMFAGPANARWADRGDHRDNRQDWTGGYYPAPPPPVIYGSPYASPYYGGYGYYPPPVVYGPGIGITLPGVTIGIR